jgi:hypothetical protein
MTDFSCYCLFLHNHMIYMLGNLGDTKEIQDFEIRRIAVFKTRFVPSPKKLLRVLANCLQNTTKPKSK